MSNDQNHAAPADPSRAEVDAIFGPVIFSYSRADAIADGALVDAGDLAREAGFTVPVAISAAAWADCVAWTDADNDRKDTWQDQTGRLWDVLWMASLAGRRTPNGRRLTFEIMRVPREGQNVAPQCVQLVLHIGPGDGGEPVITIMQPGED